jgi:hypothetical protein
VAHRGLRGAAHDVGFDRHLFKPATFVTPAQEWRWVSEARDWTAATHERRGGARRAVCAT